MADASIEVSLRSGARRFFEARLIEFAQEPAQRTKRTGRRQPQNVPLLEWAM
jgi:hypothetical protein